MLALTCLPFLLVDSSDTLFQTKQTFVNFSPFNLSIFRVFNAITGSLRSSQIDKQQFTALFDTFFLYLDLTNGVRSTGSVVAFCCMGRPYLIPLIYQFQYLFLRRDEVFSQAMNLYLLVFVFKNLKWLVIVQQIKNSTPINFVHRNGHRKISLIILPVVNTALKQILHRQILQSLHSVCLSGASLTVGENSDCACVENEV